MTTEIDPLFRPLPSKLVRPRLHGIYPRSRLFNVLSDRDGTSAVWVCGPAGSGKTTLVNSYLDSKSIGCVWYELDESDSDIASFFYHLGRAARAFIQEGSVELPLLTPEFFPNIPVFTRRFFEVLFSRIPTPCAIVLDNYQEVGEETLLHEVLCTAINALVPGISLYVCSRLEPPAELARSRANCTLHVMGWKQLQLDTEEAWGIASRVAGVEYPKPVVEKLQAKTDGWMAGLLLLLQRGEFEDIEPHLLASHTPAEVFDYFGSVFFGRLPPEVQDILVRLSQLPRITIAAADRLAGSTAPDILESLHRMNGFTYCSVGETPIYYFHPLFQEFLQSRCKMLLESDAVRRIQAESAAAMAAAGEFEDAIDLYLRSGQVDDAIELIQAQASSLAMQGRYQRLANWIDLLPEGFAATMPWLIFWQGVCKMPYSPGEGLPCFRKALSAFEAADDPVGSYLALCGMIDAICYEGNNYAGIDPLIDKYYEFRERWGEIETPEIQLQVTSSILMALVLRRSDSPELPALMEKAWRLVKTFQDVNVTLHLFLGLLTLQTLTGDFAQAQVVLDAFKEAIPEQGPPLSHLFHMNLRAFYCWSVGRFEQGLESGERAVQIESECGIRLLHSAARAHAACSAIGLNRLDLAKRYLDEASTTVKYEGNWVQGLYHAMRSWYELRAGNIASAVFHADASYEKTMAAGCLLNMPLTHGLMAVVRYEEGRKEEALEHLAAGFEAGKRYRPPLYEFFGHLFKARVALDDGDDEQADAALRTAFHIGARWNYCNHNHWQPEVMARLCAEALKRNIEPEYARSLIQQHGLVPESPPLDVPGWPWPVRIFTFGGFRLEKNGGPVVSSRKAQQRLLSVLKYLAARGGRNVSDFEIQDAIWPDAAGDSARNAYATALHRLRKLLENDAVLVRAEGALSFDGSLVWVDALAFEQSCRRIEKMLAGEPDTAGLVAARDELMVLYRGPFLPGEQSAWAIPMRERLQARFLYIIQALARSFERLERLDDAEACCRHGLAVDPLIESLYCSLMQIMSSQGRKVEALKLYEQCRVLLDSELGLEPSPALDAVKRSLFDS